MTNYTFNNHGNILTWKGPATNNPLQISPESLNDNIHSEKFIVHLTYKTMVRHNLALISKSSVYRNNWRDFFHDNNDYAKTHKFQHEFQVEYAPSSNHGITSGVEFIYHRTKSSIFSNPYTYDIGIYLQDEFRFSQQLRFTIGARYDHHQVKDLFSEDQVSPKFGMVYQPFPLTAIRLSTGKGFRAASIAEIFTSTLVSGFKVIPNLNLRAESAWSYEIGIYQTLNSNFIFDAAYFHNDYKNMIEPTLSRDIASISQPTIQLNNLAETSIQGIDISLKSNFLNGSLLVNLGYTYLDANRIGEIPLSFALDELSYTPGRTLAYRPKHLIQTSLSGRYRQFLLGMDYRYISKFEEVLVFIKDDRVDQRIMDMYLEIDLLKDLKLSFRGNNILNYNYVEVERNLGPIRNFTFTVISSF